MNPTELSSEPTILINGLVGWGVVAAAVVGSFLLSRKRPDYGLGLVVAALPLYQVRGELFGLPTTLLELLLLAVVVAIATRWPAYRPVRTPYDLWLAVYVFGALVAVAVGPDLLKGLGLWRAFFLEPALWFVAAAAVFSKHPPRALLAGAIGAVGVVAVWTVGLLVGSGDLSYDGRLVGPYQSPNYTALLLVPLLLMISLWSGRRWLYARLATAVTAAVIVLATDSLGGLLAVAAAALVAAYTYSRRRSILVVGAIGIVAGAIFFGPALFSSPPPPPTTDTTIDPDNPPPPPPNLSPRTVLWNEAAALIKEDPLFPSAPGQFQQTLADRVNDVEVYRLYVAPYALNPHNFKLSVWVEWGLLSLLGLFGLLVTCLVMALRGRPLAVVSLAMLTATIVHGIVDTPVLKNDLAILLMLTLVLTISHPPDAATLSNTRPRAGEPRRQPRRTA